MCVLRSIRAIPRGEIRSYGEVARLAGMPGAARYVGYVLRSSPLAADVPWHRVVNASGRIALRGDAAMWAQRDRLVAEGWTIRADGKIESRLNRRAGNRKRN